MGEKGHRAVRTFVPDEAALALADVIEASARPLPLSETPDAAAAFVQLFELLPDACFRLDASGRIRAANVAALRLTGYPWRDLAGQRVHRLLTPPSRRRLATEMRAWLSAGRAEPVALHLRCRDGDEIPVSASGTIVGGGRSLNAIVVVRDLSERARLESRLATMERLAIAGRLAAGIAHEIKNPLQAVMTHLSILESEIGPEFPERLSLDRIGEGVHRIQQIVSDFLDLQRGSDAGREPVDVGRVASEAVGLVERSLRLGGIKAIVEVDSGVPPIRALSRHVYQIVLNLLLNAIDAMPAGGDLALRVRHVRAGRRVEIDVADTGEGMSEELLGRLFDPFRTTRGQAGTGLGLFVTLGLVRQHGGEISVDSRPGRGTSFRVSFPAGVDAPAPSPAVTRPGDSGRAGHPAS